MTKLLAKRESVAAQIFDRLRYRIVTERRDQIPAVVLALTERLFPFNHTIPDQTQNNLIGFGELIGGHPDGGRIGAALQFPHDEEEPDPARLQNDFSGRAYRVLNFVVDLPVRIDEFIPRALPAAVDLGRIVYSLGRVPGRGRGDAAEERGRRQRPRSLQAAPAQARPAPALARARGAQEEGAPPGQGGLIAPHAEGTPFRRVPSRGGERG